MEQIVIVYDTLVYLIHLEMCKGKETPYLAAIQLLINLYFFVILRCL